MTTPHENPPGWQQILNNPADAAVFADAVAAGDVAALAADAVNADLTGARLTALVEHLDTIGAQIALSLCVHGITDRSTDPERLKGITEFLDHSGALPLTTADEETLIAHIDANPASPTAAPALQLVRRANPELALDTAMRLLADATSVDGAFGVAIELLGASTDPAHAAILIALADRLSTSQPPNRPPQPATTAACKTVLQSINAETTALDDDTADRLIGVVQRHSQTGTDAGGLAKIGSRLLTTANLTLIRTRLGTSTANSWPDTTLIPALIEHRADDLIATLPDWPGPLAERIIDKPTWQPATIARLPKALRDTGLYPPAINRALQSSGDPTVARAVINEVLDGCHQNLEPTTVDAFRTIPAGQRAAVISRCNFKQPERAARLGRLLVAIQPEDVIDQGAIRAKVAELNDGALESLVAEFSDVEGLAVRLAQTFRTKPVAAALAADGHTAAGELVAHLETTVPFDLELFGGLLAGDQRDRALELGKQRLYNITKEPADDRLALLETYLSRAVPLLVEQTTIGILTDWRHVQPPAVLVHLFEALVRLYGDETLEQILPPTEVWEQLHQLLTDHDSLDVRRAGYALIAAWPGPKAVEILAERRAHDVALEAEISRACRQVAESLDQHAAHGELDMAGRIAVTQDIAKLDESKALHRTQQLIAINDPIPESEHLGALITMLGDWGGSGDVAVLESFLTHPSAAVSSAARKAILRLRVGDIAATHDALAELADVSDPTWASINPSKLYGNSADALQNAINEVLARQHADPRGAIQYLDETAKELLLRLIEVHGTAAGLSSKILRPVLDRTADYGGLLHNQQLTTTWPFVQPLAALHQQRQAHATPKGSRTPAPPPTEEDWVIARGNFRHGAQPLLDMLRKATQ